jgi:hypothetical protein
MTTRMNGGVLLGGLAVLISGCAVVNSNPVAPSLAPNQFIVIVKGEEKPLRTFRDYVEEQIRSRKLLGCERKIPDRDATAATASVDDQLVYQCAAPNATEGGSLLAIFATAYGNSIASLLEMKITTSGACVARTCYGGPYRYWRQSPPCMYAC